MLLSAIEITHENTKPPMLSATMIAVEIMHENNKKTSHRILSSMRGGAVTIASQAFGTGVTN